MGSQRVGHDWVTELNWKLLELLFYSCPHFSVYSSQCELTRVEHRGIELGTKAKKLLFPGGIVLYLENPKDLIQNILNIKHWWESGAIGMLIHCSWECKRVRLFWKTVCWFLTKLNIFLSYNLAVVLLGIYINELKTYVHMKSCTQMFITAWFMITKSQ